MEQLFNEGDEKEVEEEDEDGEFDRRRRASSKSISKDTYQMSKEE
jgi:hypothetical protein